jgi:serine/threonine protein phosphatase PrpC
MPPLRLSAFGGTDVGRRSQNEDEFLLDHRAGLYCVADGMGGYEGGEIASSVAVTTLYRFFSKVGDASWEDPAVREARMDMAFRLAHHEVTKRRLGEFAEMGTTLAALRVESDKRAVIAHVGDSRIYRLRDNRLSALTRDHTLVEELKAAGISPGKGRVSRHVLTRALGVGDPGHETRTVSLEPGDRYLLCSDGLSNVVSERRMASILSSAPGEMLVPALISEAWRNDARDNITAVIVAID